MSKQTIKPNLPARSVGQPAAEFITAEGFAAMLQISKRTLFRLRAQGVLPTPVEISTNLIRWRLEDVRAYLNGLRPRKPRRRNGI